LHLTVDISQRYRCTSEDNDCGGTLNNSELSSVQNVITQGDRS